MSRTNTVNLQRLKMVWPCQGSVNLQRLKKVWPCQDSMPSSYGNSKRYCHVKTQCHHLTETQKGMAMSRLNTINMTQNSMAMSRFNRPTEIQNSMAMSRFNQSTEINKRYGHVMVHHHLWIIQSSITTSKGPSMH